MSNKLDLVYIPDGDVDELNHSAPDAVHTTEGQDHTRQHREHEPSVQAYGEWMLAYQHFNTDLFLPVLGRRLPPCLITFQRRSMKTLGYFHGDRFGHNRMQGKTTDEIAMNPRFFANRDIKDSLSTLVHEMAHLHVHHFGKRSRGGYHSREWANVMIRLGLHPTDNGRADGKQTGQRVGHLIVTGGTFDVSADKLLSDEFRISWYDRMSELMQDEKRNKVGATGTDLVPSGETRELLSGKRAKFSCPECLANAWGKPTLKVICAVCKVLMLPTA